MYMGRCPVGLTNTAIAQIMASLEPELTCEGISMDWSYLKESKSISYDDPYEKWNMVASLFKYVYDSTSSSPVWELPILMYGQTQNLN